MEGETIIAKASAHTRETTIRIYSDAKWIGAAGCVEEKSEEAAAAEFRRSQKVRSRLLYKDTVRYSWVEVMPWHEKK